MKVTAELTPEQGGIEVHALKPKEHEYKLLGRVRRIKGLRLWSIDRDGNIEEVHVVRDTMVDLKGQPLTNDRATVDTTKRYCQALNKANAARKFNARRP